VASEEAPGHFASVGIYIDAGSRYENDHNAGSSHLIDRLAFKVLFFFIFISFYYYYYYYELYEMYDIKNTFIYNNS